MLIRNVTHRQIEELVSRVSREYGDNIVTHENMHQMGSRVIRVQGRIRAVSSRGPGARTSWSGRRTVSACWHVHRDLFRLLFEEYPDATVTTAMAQYTADNFEGAYRLTAYQNIGSMVAPAYMPELCEC